MPEPATDDPVATDAEPAAGTPAETEAPTEPTTVDALVEEVEAAPTRKLGVLGWVSIVWLVGITLAVMILPIITAVSREVFLQTPKLHEEAALALGATRWEMIRMAVLPFGRSGIISGAMLGLGRALGETMAVAIILSVSGAVTFNLISSSNPSTIAANIALNYKEATAERQSLLIATGLVLFVVTFLVNFAARWVAGRSARKLAR